MNITGSFARIVLLGAAVVAAPAQSGGSGSVGSPPVRIYVTATRGEEFVTALPASAFTVLENGKRQPLMKVEPFAQPVSWSLLIDSSGSVRPIAQLVRVIEQALVEAMPPEDEISVFHFNNEWYLDAKLTRDRQQIRRAFDRLDPRAGSGIRVATLEAIRYLTANAANDRKVIVLLSDGLDNFSTIPPDDVVEALQKSGIALYSLSLDVAGDRATLHGQMELQFLVKPTGGINLHSPKVAQLSKAAASIPREVHSQYVLTYLAPDRTIDPRIRKIQVKTQGESKGAKLRVKSAYYPSR